MTDADCLFYATFEDIELCPGDEFDDIWDWYTPEIEPEPEILPTEKDNRRERFSHRKSFQNSKLRDHRRFGKCGWVGGNPRYSNPKNLNQRIFDSRAADKTAFVCLMLELHLQKIEEATETAWESYEAEYEAEMDWRIQYEREYWADVEKYDDFDDADYAFAYDYLRKELSKSE